MKLDRITSNPARLSGQPCIRNLRLTVRRVVELAALYPDRAELRREFPELDDEDIRQALVYAAGFLDDCVLELESAIRPGFGNMKGQIVMADDFDAPLDEFAEYTP